MGCESHLEQVEDLLAEVQFKVGVVGSGHVVDEHQAVPLSLKASFEDRSHSNNVRKYLTTVTECSSVVLTSPQPGPAGRRAPAEPRGCPSCWDGAAWLCTRRLRRLKGREHSDTHTHTQKRQS